MSAGFARRRLMVKFGRRLFPERRYRLPVKWVLLAVMAGLALVLVWALRRLFG
jgi:hypothetical protein